MAKNKSQKIKTYLVFALSVVFVIVGYFRFIHAKITRMADTIPAVSSLVKLDMLQFSKITTKNSPQNNRSLKEPLRTALRDVFAPIDLPESVKSRLAKQKSLKESESDIPPPPPPIPDLKLKGTIVGSGAPIAIINGQFVRKGETIEGYEVIDIAKDAVRLSVGKYQMVLEVIEVISNAEK